MQVATNPQTGEKVQWNGSAWVPLAKGASPAPAALAQSGGPITIGTPQPQTDIRQVGDELGVVDKRTGHFTPTYTAPPKAQTDLKQIPQGAAAGIQANIESLRQVEQALNDLDPDKGGRPQSIGWGTGALGDKFTQFNDPGGTNVRADIGQIGAVKIHDLSGAAVSASEAPRFQPFVPTVTDQPNVARDKLSKFRDSLKAQIGEALNFYGPENGYMQFHSPSADAFKQGQQPQSQPQGGGTDLSNPEAQTTGGRFGNGLGVGNTEVQFGDDPDARSRAQTFHDQLYQALRSKQLKDPAAVNAWVQSFNEHNHSNYALDWRDPGTRKAIVAAAQGKAFGVAPFTDPKVEQRVQELQQSGGGTGTSSGVAGVADAVSVGLDNKIAAGLHAVDQSLQGQGSLADNYRTNLDADRQYEQELQQQHPYFYGGGQIVGGIASAPLMPGVSSARTLPELARVGATLGAVHGYNSADGNMANRVLGAVEEGAAGAVAPAVLVPVGRGLKAAAGGLRSFVGRAPSEVPPLVDPATGELNQPMDAMRPAERVAELRDLGLNTVTPGMAGGRTARVIEQGFNNLPGSAGTMEDVNSAASGELRRAMQGVAGQFGSSRTLNEGGAELQRGAQSYIDRADSVAGKLYKSIPVSDKAPATLNNTTTALDSLSNRFSSNPDLADMLNSPRFAKIKDALDKHGLSWEDLKQFRSMVGDKIGEMRFGENDNTSDFRSLYGALSEDMRATARAQGPEALRAFERANSFYREKEAVIDGALTRILGQNAKGSPEKAAAAVQAMTRGGKASGDLNTLRQIRGATIKSGAWDEIASSLIHLGGQPASSEGRAFNPDTFVNWYADMSEQARGLLFKPELRKSLDRFVAANQQLSRVKGLANKSQTAPVMFGGGTLLAAGAAVFNPLLGLKLAGTMGANYGMGKIWTNQAFVNWASGYTRALASGNANAVNSQLGRLSKIASTNPELREPIKQVFQHLANDNAPMIGTLAASPDQRPQDQAQPQQ